MIRNPPRRTRTSPREVGPWVTEKWGPATHNLPARRGTTGERGPLDGLLGRRPVPPRLLTSCPGEMWRAKSFRGEA